LSMGTSSRFVEEENRTNGRKKSPGGSTKNAQAGVLQKWLEMPP
jgi:hypothetical protein